MICTGCEEWFSRRSLPVMTMLDTSIPPNGVRILFRNDHNTAYTRFVAFTLLLGLFVMDSRPLRAQEQPEVSSKPSYVRLAESKLAEVIKLTDEQRRKVADLITARAEAISKAAPDERAQVLIQSERDLAAVLTDEQRALFTKETTESRLRFNFRFQRWADVLDWFAKQADLSLILDAPPPGTFNYSDSKEYTVVEALDELNRILSTKGYTLIRSGRMLIVIDLQDGIPEGLIPRITVDELAKRGKFELVSVVFPLGGRDAQAVKTEVASLLGPFGKSVLLPQTKQLIVSDTAGIVRAVNTVITSIPEPTAAAAATPPALGVYPINGADAKVAEEVLIKMFPGAKIAADVKAEQINAFATPAELEAIKNVVLQMQAQISPDKKPRLEVYPVRDQEPTQLIASLAVVAPTARLTFDNRERQIVAFASPLDHTNIKTALEKLAGTGPVEKTRQLDVYRLSKADPTSTLTLLQGLLPQTKLSIDPQTRRLIAFASADDHKAIKAILDQLQSTEPGADTQTLQFYPLDHPLPTNAISVLTTLAPKSQIVANLETKQLQVLASPADHELIKTNLDIFMKGVPVAEKKKLTAYKVTALQKTRFQTLLPTLTTDFPDVRIVPDGEANELAIWAKPSQHELLKALIETLVSDVPEDSKSQLMSHPLRSADPTSTSVILKSLTPDAKISLDSVNRNLIAIASADDHKIIKSTIEKLQPGDLGPDAPLLRFYPLEQPLPAPTLAAFTKLVPKATVTPDVDGKWLQVVATLADHALVKSHLEDLTKEMPIVEKRKLMVYAVTASQRLRFQTLLPSLVTDLPEIRVVAESGPNELAIWAKPSQHTVLKSILDELKRETPEVEKNQLRSYPLKFADPATALTVLQPLFPGAKINVDANTNRLLIWTRPADHPAIKEAIEELDGEKLSERQDKVMVYPVPEIDPDVAVSMLQQILPKVRITKDLKARTVIAWGKKADHELIARTLATMRESAGGDQKQRMKIYQAGKINAVNMIEVLRQTFPNAKLAVDLKTGGLAALGTEAEHEEIQSAINQMLAQAIGETGRFVAYRLFKTERPTAIGILTQAVPEARISSGADPTQLLAWARPADHVIIERIIEELESGSPPNKNFELKVYAVKSAVASNVMPLIGRAVPKAMVNPSSDPYKLVIWALPTDHALIANIIKQFDSEHAPDTKVEFYDVQKVDADSALRLVQTVLQKQGAGAGTSATLIPGTHQLYVEARPEQHEMIRERLKGLRLIDDTGFEVFQLETVEAFTADSLIRRMFSGTRTPAPIIEADANLQKLYIKGTKEQLVRVRELLEKMGEPGGAAPGVVSNRRVRVIHIGGDALSTLTEIQRIWPQLRSNELQIIPPASLKSNLITPRTPTEQELDLLANPAAKPESKESPKSKLSPKPDEDDEEEDDDQADLSLDGDQSTRETPQQSPRKNDRKSQLPVKTAVAQSTQTATDAQTGESPTSGARKIVPPPVVILPRDGNVTILSDDTEALDQLDKLLRALSPATEAGGRTFAVYALKYAGAVSVAETVSKSLRLQSSGANSRIGQSAPTVVADERLNAIVVHANRNDRAAIEKLIEALDSSEIPDSFGSYRPRRVPVKYAAASQIETVLRLVYKTQLTSGGGRKEIPIPAGFSSEIAATIQQMNAANTGPLLTLGVDQVTNSIVVMAPNSLAEQVTKVIEDLDQASLTEDAQATSIVPTKRMNANRAKKVLDLMLDKSKRQKRP